MADNVENYISTPSGYATPEQLNSTREYAKALLYGNGQQPIHHWAQGISNIVSALVGGNLDYKAGQQQQGSQQYEAAKARDTLNGTGAFPNGGAAPVPFSEARPSEGDKTAEGGSDMDRAARVTSSQESGGNYQSIGNVTKNGDRAYGKYQVMGNNIPQWTAEALGKPMNIADFVHNPEAQDAVYKHKMGQYMAKYGPEGAARAWFAGEAGMHNPNATDVNHMSVDRYGKNFASAFARSGGASPASSAAPVQAITTALRGGTPSPLKSQIPDPAPGQAPLIDPRLVRPQTNITPDQLKVMLGNNYLGGPAEGWKMYDRAIQQGQPVKMPYAGGYVIVDPRTGREQFVPELQKGEITAGRIKAPYFGTFDPRSGFTYAPQGGAPAAAGPRSDAGPAASPTAAPTGGPAASPASVVAQAANAPAPATSPLAAAPAVSPLGAAPIGAAAPAGAEAGAAAPEGNEGNIASTPVQVASLDPAAGVASTAPKAPAAAEKPVKIAQAAGQPPKDVNARLAQAVDPNIIPQWMWDMDKKSMAIEKDAEVKAEGEKSNQKLNAKRYENILGATEAAQSQLGNLRTATRMMNDPDFYSGFGAEPVEGIKKIIAAIGGNPNAAAPMEVFRKTMASQIASSLKAAYGGLGQIRNKEIELQEKSNGSLNTSPAANRALVEISRRNAERVLQIGEMAQQYRLGHAVIDPITGKELVPASKGANGKPAQRVGLDPEYDAAVTKFIKQHELFSDDEYGAWDKLFSEKTKAIGIHKAGEGPKGTGFMDAEGHEIPAGAIDDLYKNPNSRNMFDSTFGKGASDKIIGPHKQQEKADG